MARRAAKTQTTHDPRRSEILEALVELYFRLNGYFCIRNYLQHLATGFGLETESDLLAIRLPHRHRHPQDSAKLVEVFHLFTDLST